MTKPLSAPFIVHDAGALAGAVVLRPSASVDQLPPMKAEPSPIAERAIEQHAILVRTLRDRGVDVTVLEPSSAAPAEALIGDCAIVLANGAIMMRPSDLARRGDVAIAEAALTALGVPVIGRIEAPGLLDGSDVAIGGDRIVVGVVRPGAGLRARSNAFGRAQLEALAREQNVRVVEVALASDVLRLRQVFNFIARDTVIAAPDRVDLVPVSDLRAIEVPRGEELAANVVALGERRVLGNLRFRESITMLRAAKIDVEAIDLWEFGKAGYGPAQLVLATKRG